MLPEPTFNSFLTIACVLLALGAGGLAVRRGPTTRLLALTVMSSAAVLVFAGVDRYFGTASARIVAAFVLGLGFVQAAAVGAVILARGTRDTSER